jgi:nicotinate-nucleotide pyrophosphorylase (carboxylating)
MSLHVYGMPVNDFIEEALLEDVGDGDHTSLACIDENAMGKAEVKVKEPGVIAGLALAEQILNYVDTSIKVKLLCVEGKEVESGEVMMSIEGKVLSLLKAERITLNCLQRMSGIATKTRKLAKLIEGTGTKILDTRKTTPNFRRFEKWAVQIGGGNNHRFGLYDMILIKDNHIDASGGIVKAVQRASKYIQEKEMDLKIEIETRNLTEVNEVLHYGNVHRIMLDNFSLTDLRNAVKLIDNRFETEASGSINEETILGVAKTGVNFISVGALTHSYKSLDINMKIERL